MKPLDFALAHPARLQRDSTRFNGSLAANAGSSVIGRISVPLNMLAHVHAYIKAAAGDLRQLTASAVSTGADTATVTAHGLVTGSPVLVSNIAGSNPTGLAANTVFYVRAVDANTLSFFATKAQALANTPLIDITGAGSNVIIVGTVEQAIYELKATIRNRGGLTSLVGALNSLFSAEDVAAWDATITADDTNDAVQVNFTPDATLATRYDAVVEYILAPADAA